MLFCFQQKKYPILRFKGFNDNWNNDLISNLFIITRGCVLDKKSIFEFSKNNKYPVYSSQTINDGLMGYFNNYLYENSLTWTTDGAKAGTVKYRDHKFYCTNVCGVLCEKKLKPLFYLSLILDKEFKKYVMKELGNPKLMNNVVSKIKINFPDNKKEINKIEYLFTKINNCIKNMNKYINNLKNQKKYYLKKMFI